MTNENAANPSPRPFGWLPWLLAGGAFVLYLVTLHPGLTPANMYLVSTLSGWSWRPNVFEPVATILTIPMAWLPTAWVPLAMNLFTAACGSLTIALLARSVALLPHDRTHDQRERELSPAHLLTIRHAWLPPVFAALVCGVGLTFWQGATQGSPGMVDVLLFAYCVRCLLEFRIGQRESWMVRFALVYGLAAANNWVMVLFFPAFLAAVVWIKGLSFFNLKFIVRTAVVGLIGLSLFLVLPVAVHFAHPTHVPIALGVRILVKTYTSNLGSMTQGLIAGLCLSSVVPMTLMGIRWTSFFGDTSKLGVFLATSMFHLVHGFLMLFCLWTALDTAISPRGLYPRDLLQLPLYFAGALSIGYFSGYFLLVFGKKVAKGRRHIHPAMNLVNACVVAAVWILLVIGPGLLAGRNLPVMLRNHHDALRDYNAHLEASLPAPGALILSDEAGRAFYLHEILARQHRDSQYLVIDTSSLKIENAQPGFVSINQDYVRYLERKYPQFNLSNSITNQQKDLPDPSGLVRMLANLAIKHDVYYLHPSFGFYFEAFYPRPHGLLYQLKPLPRDTFVAPRLTDDEISETEKFWTGLQTEEFPKLVRQLRPPPKNSLFSRLLEKIHVPIEPDPAAQRVGQYYSRALDSWGVDLQRVSLLKPAAIWFQQTLEIEPDSIPAQVNLEANQSLQAGKKFTLKSDEAIAAAFGRFRTWDQVLGEDGPFDEPSYCYHLGQVFTETLLFRQAIQQLERTRELMPENLNVRLILAQMYGYYVRNFSNAVLRADEALAIVPKDPSALFLKAGALIQLGEPARAIPLLTEVIAIQATNNWAAYFNRAISYLQVGDLAAAEKDYLLIAKERPTAYAAYYGLGEIAYRKKDTNTAITNYQLYLTNATAEVDPTEWTLVQNRLKELSPSKK